MSDGFIKMNDGPKPAPAPGDPVPEGTITFEIFGDHETIDIKASPRDLMRSLALGLAVSAKLCREAGAGESGFILAACGKAVLAIVGMIDKDDDEVKQ